MRWDSTWPENTSIRKRSGFAFLPMTLNGDTRWWERVEWWEECSHFFDRRMNKPSHYEWGPICWADDVRGTRSFLVTRYGEK